VCKWYLYTYIYIYIPLSVGFAAVTGLATSFSGSFIPCVWTWECQCVDDSNTRLICVPTHIDFFGTCIPHIHLDCPHVNWCKNIDIVCCSNMCVCVCVFWFSKWRRPPMNCHCSLIRLWIATAGWFVFCRTSQSHIHSHRQDISVHHTRKLMYIHRPFLQ